MATFMWIFDMTFELIRLRAWYQNEFENVSNRDHLGIWNTIATRISLNSHLLVTVRQCQIKWSALKKGYKNICRILSGNRERFSI